MSHRGFTLLETTVAVTVIGLVLGGATLFIFRNISDTRETDTLEKLLQLKRALIGDPRIVTNESRTDFGYVGDMGSLPASLEQLWIQGSQPPFTFDNTTKMGRGWQGPYVSVGPLEWFSAIPLDAWGMPIQYSIATGTSAITGQQYRARLISYGPDATLGGGDDLTLEIYKPDLLSEVVGYVRDSGLNPLSGVSVTINYPVSGVPMEESVQTDAAGAYSFSDIPLGNRSVEVEPELVYVSGTAFTTPQNTGDIVEFVVQNFSSSDITFNSFKLEYTTTAFYEQLLIGNTSVFSSTSNRAASNELLQFPTQATTVLGSGSITGQTIPVRLQSAFTQVPDQNVGESAGKGGSIRITMKNFKTVETGTGTAVNMTGLSLKATICSGAGCATPSVAIFSPVKK